MDFSWRQMVAHYSDHAAGKRMTTERANYIANLILICTLVMLSYAMQRLLQATAGHFDPGTAALMVVGGLGLMLVLGLFANFTSKFMVASCVATLVLGVGIVHLGLKFNGSSLMRVLRLDVASVAATASAPSAPRAADPAPAPPATPAAVPAPSAGAVSDPKAASTGATVAQLPTKSARVEYPSVEVAAVVLPADPETTTASDGASFLGYNFIPSGANSVLRVRVVANAYSAQDNVAVLAIFREGQKTPVKLESKSVAAGGRATFDLTVDVLAIDGKPISFDVRTGPARPGTIIINGPDAASKPADVPLPYISIEELGANTTVARAPPTATARVEYASLGTVAAILPADPATATINDGASFLGYNFVPKKANSVLHVRVVANAFSQQDNEVVLAIFREGQRTPVKLESKPVAANGRALFDVSFDLPVAAAEPIGIDVRIGPARPGTITVNGPDLASKPADIPLPYIAIEDK